MAHSLPSSAVDVTVTGVNAYSPDSGNGASAALRVAGAVAAVVGSLAMLL